MDITRRDAFAASGAAAIGLLTFNAGAAAAAMTPAEQANVALIDTMLKAWGDPKVEAAAFGAFLADDCIVKMVETEPAVTGKAATIAAIKMYLDRGLRFDIKITAAFARGPVVAVTRDELMYNQGKPGARFEAVGVYVVRDGKIKEWTDYALPAKA